MSLARGSESEARGRPRGLVPALAAEKVSVASVPAPLGPGREVPKVAQPKRTDPTSVMAGGQKAERPVEARKGPLEMETKSRRASSKETVNS